MRAPKVDTLEIDITYTCGMNCPSCNRLTDIKPGTPDERVSLEQIHHLIEDSMTLRYPWRRWWLVGGEPTTHPDLMSILDAIARYRDWRGPPECAVGLATHGYGPHTQAVLQEVQREFPFVEILNSRKTPGERRDFVAVLDAAVDRLPSLPAEPYGCAVSCNCGIAMTYAEFFPCCVAGAMYRVAGIGHPLEHVHDITVEAMRKQYAAYCPLCGYFVQESRSSTTRISPTWMAILMGLGSSEHNATR